ncbi:MAG: PEP-CTERM sorting domain-containing protein [Methanoregulaceae archaeon]|nr:PEP-CTERM sorting domain-containing protein [Methanoregulaceae archaeon]
MKRAWLSGALAIVCVAANAQTIVYNNLAVGMQVAWLAMSTNTSASVRFGDEVTLAGTDRSITQVRSILQVEGTGQGAYDFDVSMGFFALDGANNAPGTSLGGATYQIRGLNEGAGGTTAAYFLSLPVANIVVPDTVAVIFQLSRVGGNTGGVGFHFTGNPSAVGFSDPNFFWYGDGTGWTTAYFGITAPRANMSLELTAVPEPASMAILGLGVAALIRRRKKA